MVRRLSLRTIAALAMLAVYCSRALSADQLPPSESFPISPDLDAIYRRLDQQEAEIQQLHARLGDAVDGQEPLLGAANAAGDSAASTVFHNASLATPAELPPGKPSADAAGSATKLKANDPPVDYEVGSDLSMTAKWKNGLVLESPNKDFRIHIGGRVQWDITTFDNDPALTVAPSVGGIGPQPPSTYFRRARLRADGTMYETWDWVAEYDFANTLAPASPSTGQPVATVPGLTELTLTETQVPYFGNIRVGNQREPMGMEHLISDLYTDFMERSYLRDVLWGPFNNGYTPGLTLFNWTQDQRGTWGVGLYSNQADSFGYGIGGETATTGRVTYLPFYDDAWDGAYLWHVGMSGSVRDPDQGQVRLRTRGDIRSGPPGVLNPIYADTGTLNASQQDIAGVETAVVWGPLTVEAEYDGTWIQDTQFPITPTPVDRGTTFFHGGYVTVMYFLTGEHSVYNRHTGVFEGVSPLENAFWVQNGSGTCGGCGAWQLAFRYNTVDLNDDGINGGELNSFTFGINWYLNPNAKVQFNYDLTQRGEVKTVEPGDINSFGLRFAYFF